MTGRPHSVSQLELEERVLVPLRAAVARGEITKTAHGLHPRPPALFRRQHEAERFAEILARGGEDVLASVALAQVAQALERTLRFSTTGSVNGYDVQRTSVPLRGETLALYVLRDERGGIGLALCTAGEGLFCWRKRANAAWRHSALLDAAELAAQLRRSNYPTLPSEGDGDSHVTPTRVAAEFRRPNPARRRRPHAGERVISGLRASPGRAVGQVRYAIPPRPADDFSDRIFVAPSVHPDDTACLFRALGIVSTSGGILSHAGLIALQFRKPALIIPGQWLRDPKDGTAVLYHIMEYEENTTEINGFLVAVRQGVREREHKLREGDLVVLDADQGTLTVLGQSRDALTLQEGLQRLGQATAVLRRVADPASILAARGHRLQARYQLERLLARVEDPVLACHTLDELVLAGSADATGSGGAEPGHLLRLLLENRAVGSVARDHLDELIGQLQRRCEAACTRAEELLPRATSLFAILSARLEAHRASQVLADAVAILRAGGLNPDALDSRALVRIDMCARDQLGRLQERLAQVLCHAPRRDATTRHRLRQYEHVSRVLGDDGDATAAVNCLRAETAASDTEALGSASNQSVLPAAACGFELAGLIGWKAANLAELSRLAEGDLVSPWFVVTDHAFRRVLDAPLEHGLDNREEMASSIDTLRAAIDDVLKNSHLSHEDMSRRIRRLWEMVALPVDLKEEILNGHRRLAESGAPLDRRAVSGEMLPHVAVRSSTCEEDTEAAARAGEFDTFLFVGGGTALIEHVKRAWSGMWTARAIHNRIVLGADPRGVGGVIVQRIVTSRVSGVLQTVNTTEGALEELVVNAGLGLGEGIVSGAVAADHIVVDKESATGGGALRFRYLTNDKRQQVVFDQRAGGGTTLTDALYHQRLRPALEYVELLELVHVALRLEEAYGYPLDIEFAIEGSRLWILQVRPVASYNDVIRQTLEHHPLPSGSRRSACKPPQEDSL